LRAGHRVIETAVTAILDTSGSTERANGMVLSHRTW